MKNLKLKPVIMYLVLLTWGMIMIGCGSSEESSKQSAPPPPAQPSATEAMQNEMNALKTENTTLKDRIAKMEQDNRAATAHTAELETQLAEMKERLAAPPPPPPPATHPISSNTNGAYGQALSLFRSRNYQNAASTLQGILDGGNAGSLESNCHYWLGECSYATKNYQEAIEHFQKVFGYARTVKKDDAQVMIANCYFAMGDKARAKTEYQKLIDKYHASPYAKRAKAKLAQM